MRAELWELAPLERARIVAVVGELVTTSVAKHVGMSLCPNEPRQPLARPSARIPERLREHRAPTRYKWRFHALALMTAERPQFTAGQRMRRRRAIFDPADVEGAGFEVDLLPTQVDDLGRPKAMPEG
jgi:hypothetical protein